MDVTSINQHLSHIATLWTLVFKAHGRSGEQTVSEAQQVLLERYSGAVHRYLLGAVRDPETADELFQEFALRMVRGDFCKADPQHGRFRNYVKRSLSNLITDHRRRLAARAPALTEDPVDPAITEEDLEKEFLNSWRQELQEKTWLALEQKESQTGHPYYTVLRFRTDNPLLSSMELAEQLGPRLGKSYTVHAIRQTLHRAREHFADLLVSEVARTLTDATRESLESELIDLGLFTYCRAALDRLRPCP